jgi:hypothetical protein
MCHGFNSLYRYRNQRASFAICNRLLYWLAKCHSSGFRCISLRCRYLVAQRWCLMSSILHLRAGGEENNDRPSCHWRSGMRLVGRRKRTLTYANAEQVLEASPPGIFMLLLYRSKFVHVNCVGTHVRVHLPLHLEPNALSSLDKNISPARLAQL